MQGQSSVGLAGAAKDLVHEALRRQIHSSQGAVQPPRLKGRVYGGRRDAGRWEIANGRMRPCAWDGAHGELHCMEVDVPPHDEMHLVVILQVLQEVFLEGLELGDLPV